MHRILEKVLCDRIPRQGTGAYGRCTCSLHAVASATCESPEMPVYGKPYTDPESLVTRLGRGKNVESRFNYLILDKLFRVLSRTVISLRDQSYSLVKGYSIGSVSRDVVIPHDRPTGFPGTTTRILSLDEVLSNAAYCRKTPDDAFFPVFFKTKKYTYMYTYTYIKKNCHL
ncbi:hypothetical protein PUN28_019152 [Cardiocondyla obscurior]|uniref:DNA-directed RNA polymerase n=1 Tax=Cardiocondyla obscurior TaxID=286306 RepID=A0AAW2EHH1_9HYME